MSENQTLAKVIYTSVFFKQSFIWTELKIRYTTDSIP